MGLFIILPFAALACFGIVSVVRLVRRGEAGPDQWKALKLHLVAGIALGIWLGFFASYRVANKKIAGFPIPVSISSFDEGHWTADTLPVLVRYPGMVTDFLSGVALALVPMAVAAFLKQLRDRREAKPGGSPPP
jgi:ammonia channel protein AmtB